MKKTFIYNRPYFTNNDRKLHGFPLNRKLNKKRRIVTRCECNETINELINYFNKGV